MGVCPPVSPSHRSSDIMNPRFLPVLVLICVVVNSVAGGTENVNNGMVEAVNEEVRNNWSGKDEGFGAQEGDSKHEMDENLGEEAGNLKNGSGTNLTSSIGGEEGQDDDDGGTGEVTEAAETKTVDVEGGEEATVTERTRSSELEAEWQKVIEKLKNEGNKTRYKPSPSATRDAPERKTKQIPVKGVAIIVIWGLKMLALAIPVAACLFLVTRSASKKALATVLRCWRRRRRGSTQDTTLVSAEVPPDGTQTQDRH